MHPQKMLSTKTKLFHVEQITINIIYENTQYTEKGSIPTNKPNK